jgi:hypothetical protein
MVHALPKQHHVKTVFIIIVNKKSYTTAQLSLKTAAVHLCHNCASFRDFFSMNNKMEKMCGCDFIWMWLALGRLKRIQHTVCFTTRWMMFAGNTYSGFIHIPRNLLSLQISKSNLFNWMFQGLDMFIFLRLFSSFNRI